MDEEYGEKCQEVYDANFWEMITLIEDKITQYLDQMEDAIDRPIRVAYNTLPDTVIECMKRTVDHEDYAGKVTDFDMLYQDCHDFLYHLLPKPKDEPEEQERDDAIDCWCSEAIHSSDRFEERYSELKEQYRIRDEDDEIAHRNDWEEMRGRNPTKIQPKPQSEPEPIQFPKILDMLKKELLY